MTKRRWGRIIGGLGATAAVGAGLFYLHERSSEQAPFRLVDADGRFELRDYPELLVAETVAMGARERALDSGFGKLAGYIFAKSRGGDRIAMTAPVLSDDRGGEWRTRFVMPAAYDRASLPAPGPGVAIGARAARRVAVIRFSGRTDDSALFDREADLRAWMAERGLRAGGVEHAFYNSPFIPGPLRRNEVMIEVLA